MKVVHAIADITDRSSGIVRNMLALDAALRKAGIDSRICTSLRELKQVVDADTILHVHNSWMPIVLATAGVKRKTGCRLVVSPRGSMSDWALCKSKWKKRIVWLVGMRKVWTRADAFVATSEKEKLEISQRQKRMGIQRPVKVVRLGCESGQIRPRRNPEGRELHILYLGRVEPVKGLDRLLNQLNGIKNAQLRIAGPNIGGYAEILRGRDAPAPTEPHALKVEFLGEIHGEAKESAFDWADVLVLPSYSENFGSVVVEALSRGVPVIASKGTPWQEVEEIGCGWWTDDFRAAIETARSANLLEMGGRGVEWVKTYFTWDASARCLSEFYRGVINCQK